MPWSVVVERLNLPYVGAHKPDVVEFSYRRYEVTDYGVIPLIDEEWETGVFDDITVFGQVGERHYVRKQGA
jgi:hypothetical protein